MKKAKLVRKNMDDIRGVIGTLSIEDVQVCYTLERPWQNNTPEVSCIPKGFYLCKRIVSPKFGTTFEITNVKDRSHVLFHSGNQISDSRGCVLLGFQYNDSGAQLIISKSKVAHEALMKLMENENEFALEIV